MYKVKLIVIKGIEETLVKADECAVDGNNNLVFHDKAGQLVALISSSRWVSVEKNG